MEDIILKVEKIYREISTPSSGAERMRMGFEMFEMAKAMMLAEMAADGGGVSRGRIFRRLYGGEFSNTEMKTIIAALDKHSRDI
jgi:hypothetical protein